MAFFCYSILLSMFLSCHGGIYVYLNQASKGLPQTLYHWASPNPNDLKRVLLGNSRPTWCLGGCVCVCGWGDGMGKLDEDVNDVSWSFGRCLFMLRFVLFIKKTSWKYMRSWFLRVSVYFRCSKCVCGFSEKKIRTPRWTREQFHLRSAAAERPRGGAFSCHLDHLFLFHLVVTQPPRKILPHCRQDGGFRDTVDGNKKSGKLSSCGC